MRRQEGNWRDGGIWSDLPTDRNREGHDALRRIWVEGRKCFGVLEYNQHMDVHAF